MTPKAVLRFAIGTILALVLLQILLPAIGIPAAQMAPPMIAYNRATGQAKGIITGKRDAQTPSPFKVGVKVYWISYKFTAISPNFIWDKASAGKPKIFTGEAHVPQEKYNGLRIGAVVPVKYEKTYPVVNGLNLPYGNRSMASGSSLWSWWIPWALLTILIGYLLMAPIERAGLLRESY